jgi:hypothetical protein
MPPHAPEAPPVPPAPDVSAPAAPVDAADATDANLHSLGEGMPSIPLYIAPDDDKPATDKPRTPTMSTWSPSEMSAFAQGSPSWVPLITDPSQPIAAIEREAPTKDERDVRRMKTLAIGGCVVMVVAALAIGSMVLKTGKATVPPLEAATSTLVVKPRPGPAAAPKPAQSASTVSPTTVRATTTSAKPTTTTANTTTTASSTTTTVVAADEPAVDEPSAEASPAPVP